MRQVLHPQIGRPLCRVFALAGNAWPERVIAADLLHEEPDAGGLRLVAELGEELNVPVTLGAVAKQMYEAARAMGYGRNDYTAVVRPLEQLAGVEVRTS